MQPKRIAVIQHGDIADAYRWRASGEAEPYFGMYYSLDLLERLLDRRAHLIINLNAPAYREAREGHGEWVGVPLNRSIKPGLLGGILWGRAVARLVRRFAPTHVLLRSGLPFITAPVLDLCARTGARCLVAMANRVSRPRNPLVAWLHGRTIRRLNEPFVHAVGNHKRPASATLVQAGVRADKVCPYDFPGARSPADATPKTLPPSDEWSVVFTGAVSREKGVGDLIAALVLLRGRGIRLSLSVLGAGADLERFRNETRDAGLEHVEFPGRVSNQEVYRRMRAATLVCVPSRHEFAEGMPLTLTEALSARTPVIASDHPVFVESMRDGEGVVFFTAGRPAALADAILRALTPTFYEQLSASSEIAYRRLHVDLTLGNLVYAWMNATGLLGPGETTPEVPRLETISQEPVIAPPP